jgi:hypothetical protein
MKTIRQQVYNMLGQGMTREQIQQALPDALASTIRTYQLEWIRAHAKLEDQKYDKEPEEPEEEPKPKPKRRHKRDKIRKACGSGARFGPSSKFWRTSE